MIYEYICEFDEEKRKRELKTAALLGIDDLRIFEENAASFRDARPVLDKMVSKLKKGDTVYVRSLGTFGTSFSEIRNVFTEITMRKKADVVALDSAMIDTRKYKEISDSYTPELIISMLLFAEKQECERNSRKQKEAHAAATARGTKYGRPREKLPEKFEETAKKWLNGEISGVDAAAELNMPLSTFRYRSKRYAEENNAENAD